MSDISKSDLEEACQAITSMIDRSENVKTKFAEGTSQYTLQKNRINALKIAFMLVEAELTGNEEPTTYAIEDLEKAVAPIKSLFSKSEKAIGKLAQGTWQYKMLDDNIKALYVALSLLEKLLNA